VHPVHVRERVRERDRDVRNLAPWRSSYSSSTRRDPARKSVSRRQTNVKPTACEHTATRPLRHAVVDEGRAIPELTVHPSHLISATNWKTSTLQTPLPSFYCSISIHIILSLPRRPTTWCYWVRFAITDSRVIFSLLNGPDACTLRALCQPVAGRALTAWRGWIV
jgi:hypothetical protein